MHLSMWGNKIKVIFYFRFQKTYWVFLHPQPQFTIMTLKRRRANVEGDSDRTDEDDLFKDLF